MSLKKVAASLVLALSAVVPSISQADVDWISGRVILIEDVRAHWADKQILVQLGEKTYPSPVFQVCSERFRIVVGQEGVEEPMQKSFVNILLAARLSGDKVRLLVNTNNVASGGFCTVKAVAMGEV